MNKLLGVVLVMAGGVSAFGQSSGGNKNGIVSGTVGQPAVYTGPNSIGTIGVETFGAKLRRLGRNSLNNNPTFNAPLSPPPTWTINTAYVVGQVVTNGANQYICNTAGTSAGAGGPTGTGMAGITDNTATWYWMGISTPAAAAVTAPTITTSATTTLTNLYAYTASPSPFYFSGGNATDTGTGYKFLCSTNVPPGVQNNTCYWRVTFVTDAIKFAEKTNSGQQVTRFIVDGQYVGITGFINGTGANPSYNIVDFTSAGGRKVRTITIESHLNPTFEGIAVGPTEEVWAPPTTDRVRAIFEGDSIMAGGNAFPSMGGLDTPYQVCLLLGWSDCWDVAEGSTGYVATGGKSIYGSRVAADITPFSPDIVIFVASINDDGQLDATITANALAAWQATRAGLPTATIIIFGVFPSSTGPSAALLANEADIKSAFTTWADSNSYYVPIANDSQQTWISGTGKVSATTGTGNADNYVSSDGTHPTDQGRIYLAYRMAKALRSIVQQIP